MAKKKNTAAATEETAGTSTPSADPRLAELERNWQAGNYAGARRVARALQDDATIPQPARDRASDILRMTRVDPGPLLIFAGMLLVLLIVFFNAIVTRNKALDDAPPSIELNKQLAPAPTTTTPPAETVPTEGTGSGNAP